MAGVQVAVESVGAKHSGGAVVLLGILRALLADPRFERIAAFTSPRASRSFDLPASPRLVEEERPAEEISYVRRVAWYLAGLRRRCREDGAEVLFCANGLGWGTSTIPSVALVQQSLPFSQEALRTLPLPARWKMGLIRRLTTASCRRAAITVVQSRVMKEWVHSEMRIELARIEVCYPAAEALPDGPADDVDRSMSTCPEGRRLLYVGSDAPYKNLDRIAREMRKLRERVPGTELFATIPVGHPLSALEGFRALGTLGRAQLGRAYRLCDLVVQPSLVESGPLVPGEAMSAGRPLLAADRPWARDACGEAAHYFEPLKPGDFTRAASGLLLHPEEREALIEAGRGVWEKRRLLGGYQPLVECLYGVARQRQLLASSARDQGRDRAARGL